MANDVKVNVKTTHEGKGVLDRLVESLRGIKAEGGAAAKSIDAFVGIIKGPFAAIAAVAGSVAAAFSWVSKAISEFADAEQKVAKLDAALAQNGLLADDVRERYQELASELQKTTAIADDEWLAVLTKLTQFGSKPETIGLDVDAVKNLAGVVGDLQTAATMYSKALQGSFSSFARYGIIVSENANQTEKLRDLQEQLARRGGGQLEASANSLNGKFANLKNQMSDVSEAVGGGLASFLGLGKAIDFLAGGFEWWAETMGGTVSKLDGISNATNEANGATENYAANLQLVAQLSERIAQAAEAETKAIREKQRAMDEFSDAQMALDLAEIDEAERSGRMSKTGAVKARSKVRRASATSKFDREQKADLDQIRVNEGALRDLLQTRQRLEDPIQKARRSVKASNQSQADFSAAQQLIEAGKALQNEKPSILDYANPQLAAHELAKRGLEGQQMIDKGRSALERFGKSGSSRAAELSALEQQASLLDKQIAERRSGVLTENTSIAQRMVTREQVFGLNQRRDAIVGGGQVATAGEAEFNQQLQNIQNGTANVGGGLQEGLQAVIGTNTMVLQFSNQLVATQRAMEQRLRQLEAQAKNAHNR